MQIKRDACKETAFSWLWAASGVMRTGRREVSAAFSACGVAFCLLAALCNDPASTAWLVAQLLHSFYPWPTTAAIWLEDWTFLQWEGGTSPSAPKSAPSVPKPLPELPITASTAELQQPFIVRGMLNGTAAVRDADQWLRAPPISSLQVPFYSDSSKGALSPDQIGAVDDIVRAILSGGPQKLATELVVRAHPELLDALEIVPPLARLLGATPFEKWRIGKTLSVPIFMGTGSADRAVRTDLHSEPIGSATLQLVGSKRWTLVTGSQSRRLRPSIAADGRAFLRTRRAHGPDGLQAIAESGADHFEVEQHVGDMLWVPTWTWHRVDYVPNVTALSLSLFHLRAEQLMKHPLLTAAVLPALLKELVAWKTQ